MSALKTIRDDFTVQVAKRMPVLRTPPFQKSILIILWLTVQLVLYAIHGIKVANDSPSYIEYATDIAAHFSFDQGHYLRYVGYPFFVALFFLLGLPLSAVVFGQVVLSGLAATCGYRLTRSLSNQNAAFLATLLFVCWPDVQAWNFYILTESLFISLLVVCFFFLSRASSFPSLIPGLVVAVMLALVRPNGFIVLIAVLLYGMVAFARAPLQRRPYLLLPLLLLLPVLLLLLDQYLLFTFRLVETFERGDIIFKYAPSALVPANPLVMPNPQASPLAKLVFFVVYNTEFFMRLVLLKIVAFFAHIKPYYSVRHNLLIMVVLYPAFFFALRGLLRKGIPIPVKAFAGTVVLLQTVMVALTVEDWDGRFLLSVLPLIFIFAAVGVFPPQNQLKPPIS
jgi:4-amino-4-deoxy-L-arabinose transferase-like glycosyltransferase